MNIAIYTLTSELHDANAVKDATREFLNNLEIEYTLKGNDFSDYGQCPLCLIYVRTGGTEGVFKRLLPELLKKSSQPFLLLASGKSNSLPASMEILSFLRGQGIGGEIIHGKPEYVRRRILQLQHVSEARRQLRGMRLGVIGKPSDWLIASHADHDAVRRKLGIELVDIDMQELLDGCDGCEDKCSGPGCEGAIERGYEKSLPGAEIIYHALKGLVEEHRLQGLTLRCFDLLSAVKNTGCLALARLNAEGIVGSCEGDVPAMLTMAIAQALTGLTGFQANPACIDTENGEMVLAHCTIPLNMVERYELTTHFESGIGVGIRGFMKEGAVTIFKVSGDLSHYFIAEGQLIRNEAKPDLCRTQQVIRLDDKSQTAYFLNNPIGNHHIVIPGHHRELLEEFLK